MGTLTICGKPDLIDGTGGRIGRRQLEAMTGQRVDWFACPAGDYDRRVAQAVRAAGYRWAFALVPKRVGLAQYEIPRVDISFPYPYYLDAKLSGLHQRPIGCFELSVEQTITR